MVGAERAQSLRPLTTSGLTEAATQTAHREAAALLLATLGLYLVINAGATRRTAAPPAPLAAGGGFGLVFRSGYLRLVALLIVLLNLVNTTGEYLTARLSTAHAAARAAADPSFNQEAYLGAFTGSYQFWVNVTAFVLQAFVTSRLVKYQGLRGALLALPLIALGGYSIIAAGAGFALVRWVKTAENANTRPSRPSIRSSCVPATCCPPRLCTWARP